MDKIKELTDEKNEYIRKMNMLESWKEDCPKGEVMFVSGNIDDLENNILYYKENIERVDAELEKIKPCLGGK